MAKGRSSGLCDGHRATAGRRLLLVVVVVVVVVRCCCCWSHGSARAPRVLGQRRKARGEAKDEGVDDAVLGTVAACARQRRRAAAAIRSVA